jgi:catechol 2,3-dioxygenase-like lactoylglutathione lyase family enzyme
MSLFRQFTHVSVTVTDVAKAREFYSGLRQVFVKDPDGNMVEFIGPSRKAGARVMESAGTHQ